MLGMVKYSNIMFKWGIFQGDNDFFKWWKMIKLNKIECRDIIISLFNEEYELIVVWKVKSVFFIKV